MMVARNATHVNSPGPAHKAETGAVCVLGGADVTTLRDRCRALGVTDAAIADRAGVSRAYVTQQFVGLRRPTTAVRDAAEALLRERLAQQVATLGCVMAATLQEQAAGGDPQ